MPSKRKFYRTVIQVTVLSEDEPVAEGLELDQVHYMITVGDCSGRVEISREMVPAEKMAKLLEEQGSDPAFFQLDENGEDLL